MNLFKRKTKKTTLTEQTSLSDHCSRHKLLEYAVAPLFVTAIVSLVLCSVEVYFIYGYGTPYDGKVIAVSVFITLMWVFASLVCYIKCRSAFNISAMKLIKLIIISISIAVYFIYVVWNQGYHTLDVYRGLATGAIGIDTMDHTGIVQTLINYGTPAWLYNGISFFGYHIGSHLIFALISLLTGVHPVFVYCYYYPIIFMPLFTFSFFYLIALIRAIVLGKEKKERFMEPLDFFVGFVFFSGVMPYTLYYQFGVFIKSNFISESHCVAMTIALIHACFLAAGKLTGLFENKKYRYVMLFLINPVIVFYTCITKVSVGVIVAFVIGLYYLKKILLNKNRIESILSIVFSSGAFLIGYLSMKLMGSTGTKYTALEPIGVSLFAYIRKYTSVSPKVLNYFVVFFVVIIIVVERWRKEKIRDILVKNEYTFDLILLITMIMVQIPGLFFDITGGSAAYFVLSVLMASHLMFLAYDYPTRILLWTKARLSMVSRVIIALMCVLIVIVPYKNIDYKYINLNRKIRWETSENYWQNTPRHFSSLQSFGTASYYRNNTTVKNLEYIYDKVGNEPGNYYIFLDLPDLDYLENLPADYKNPYEVKDDDISDIEAYYGIYNHKYGTKEYLINQYPKLSSEIIIYPSYTSVAIINAIYKKPVCSDEDNYGVIENQNMDNSGKIVSDGDAREIRENREFFYYSGQPVVGIDPNAFPIHEWLSFDDALKIASSEGKKGVFYVTRQGVELVECKSVVAKKVE